MDDFEWPCDRRDAHGPHTITWTESGHGCDGTEESCMENCPVPIQQGQDCPGVRAHPDTQIGRPAVKSQKPTEPVSGYVWDAKGRE
jgi:hypothetical protein